MAQRVATDLTSCTNYLNSKVFYSSDDLSIFQIAELVPTGYCYSIYSADSATLSAQLVAVGSSIEEITSVPAACPNDLGVFYVTISSAVNNFILSLFSIGKLFKEGQTF